MHARRTELAQLPDLCDVNRLRPRLERQSDDAAPVRVRRVEPLLLGKQEARVLRLEGGGRAAVEKCVFTSVQVADKLAGRRAGSRTRCRRGSCAACWVRWGSSSSLSVSLIEVVFLIGAACACAYREGYLIIGCVQSEYAECMCCMRGSCGRWSSPRACRFSNQEIKVQKSNSVGAKSALVVDVAGVAVGGCCVRRRRKQTHSAFA